MMKKIVIPVIIVIVITLCILGYFFWKKPAQENSSSVNNSSIAEKDVVTTTDPSFYAIITATPTVPIESYLTYETKNDEYAIEYPPGWAQVSGGSAMFMKTNRKPGSSEFKVGITHGIMSAYNSEGMPQEIDKETWLNIRIRNKPLHELDDKLIRMDDVIRNNLEMVRVVTIDPFSEIILTYYYFTDDHYVYRIYLYPYDPASSDSADFEQMVNSFRIIEGWD